MHFVDRFVIEKKSGVTRMKSGNKLFAQGRRIPQLAVSQCIDLSTAAGISANCFHCSCLCYATAASGSDRSESFYVQRTMSYYKTMDEALNFETDERLVLQYTFDTRAVQSGGFSC